MKYELSLDRFNSPSELTARAENKFRVRVELGRGLSVLFRAGSSAGRVLPQHLLGTQVWAGNTNLHRNLPNGLLESAARLGARTLNKYRKGLRH